MKWGMAAMTRLGWPDEKYDHAGGERWKAWSIPHSQSLTHTDVGVIIHHDFHLLLTAAPSATSA